VKYAAIDGPRWRGWRVEARHKASETKVAHDGRILLNVGIMIIDQQLPLASRSGD